MKIGKTTLQRIVEQKAEQIRIAIEEAIDAGAKIEKSDSVTDFLKCGSINGLYLQKNTSDGTIAMVLHFKSKKIAELFEPNLQELREQAEQKREELQRLNKQIEEIEKNETRNY